MTAVEYQKFVLYCDGMGGHCPETFKPAEGGARVIPRARTRQQAGRAGWEHVRSPMGRKYDRDLCPGCTGEAEK